MSDDIEEAKSNDINELIVHEKGLPNAFIVLLPILFDLFSAINNSLYTTFFL